MNQSTYDVPSDGNVCTRCSYLRLSAFGLWVPRLVTVAACPGVVVVVALQACIGVYWQFVLKLRRNLELVDLVDTTTLPELEDHLAQVAFTVVRHGVVLVEMANDKEPMLESSRGCCDSRCIVGKADTVCDRKVKHSNVSLIPLAAIDCAMPRCQIQKMVKLYIFLYSSHCDTVVCRSTSRGSAVVNM